MSSSQPGAPGELQSQACPLAPRGVVCLDLGSGTLLSHPTKGQGSRCPTQHGQGEARPSPDRRPTQTQLPWLWQGPRVLGNPGGFIAGIFQINVPCDLGKCHRDSSWRRTDSPSPQMQEAASPPPHAGLRGCGAALTPSCSDTRLGASFTGQKT